MENETSELKEDATISVQEELAMKRQQLKDKNARLHGGFSPTMGRELLAIDKEINDVRDLSEIKKIELDYLIPLTPYWKYEQVDRWVELNKKKLKELISNLDERLNLLLKQKEDVQADILRLEQDIQKLEKDLNTMGELPSDSETSDEDVSVSEP